MLFALDHELIFPPTHLAEPDGLLAVGGDLSRARLLLAYRSGIFPWYEGEHILWWCPDPRFVLEPSKILVSKSMQKIIDKGSFTFSTNQAFEQVIFNCKSTPRNNQHGTWITDDVERAFCDLHDAGYAHSAETWLDGKLVGGLYGVKLGKVFFGESMFSSLSNASKYAFIKYAAQLNAEEVKLIDCQVYTSHLESLGAHMIPRTEFLTALDRYC